VTEKPEESLPWAKWFWRDWLSDTALRMCSSSARGVWADVLCLMGQSEPPGYLLHNGRTLTIEEISRLIGTPTDELTQGLAELETHGVFSRNRDGVPYSRRIVREAQRRQRNQENGRKGGNPNFRGRQAKSEVGYPTPNPGVSTDQKPPVEANRNPPDNPQPKPQRPEARDSEARVLAHGLSEDDQKWAELRTRLVDLYEGRGCAVPIDTHWVEIWRQSNYDPNLCLTVVRETLTRSKRSGFHPGLKYFDEPLREQHEKVWSAQKTGNGAATAQPLDWERFVKVFVETQAQVWLGHPHPRPGSGGCPVPREVIAKYRDRLEALVPGAFSSH